MAVLLRARRFVVLVAALACAFLLYLWVLHAIQTAGVPSSRPGIEPRGGDVSDGLLVGEDLDTDAEKAAVLTAEQREREGDILAERRERLEREKQDARNCLDQLRRRLAAVASDLEELRAVENAVDTAWNVLVSDDQNGARFNEAMADDYLGLYQQRESFRFGVDALSERRNLLDSLLRHFGGEEIGITCENLTPTVDELEANAATLFREYGELTRRAERLAERARSGSSQGETLAVTVARIEAIKVAPELDGLCSEREDALAAECDDLLQRIVEQMRMEIEEKTRQRRSTGETETAEIRGATAKSLAEHKAEQKRLDEELEMREAKVAFQQSRTLIEHYLVPFIALKRTYTTPALMGDEIKEFVWADIPLEKAASLTDIKDTGVFQQGPGEYKRLERYVVDRLEYDMKEWMLPFGQHWSVRDDEYLILARELLMKHGPAMVEAGLLRQ